VREEGYHNPAELHPRLPTLSVPVQLVSRLLTTSHF
jgi:hypothetical protein